MPAPASSNTRCLRDQWTDPVDGHTLMGLFQVGPPPLVPPAKIEVCAPLTEVPPPLAVVVQTPLAKVPLPLAVVVQTPLTEVPLPLAVVVQTPLTEVPTLLTKVPSP